MCGIVGVVAKRDVTPLLIEGLRRLEYRGYDSAGIAVQSGTAILERVRTVGKVDELARALEQAPISGRSGWKASLPRNTWCSARARSALEQYAPGTRSHRRIRRTAPTMSSRYAAYA